jgi:hypothetical protein
MPSPEFHAEQWEDFADEYSYLPEEVYGNLASESHLFDVKDGIHAKFTQDGELGLLLVFDPDEADGLLAAYYAGLEGVEEATATFAMWAGSLMGMIRHIMDSLEEY